MLKFLPAGFIGLMVGGLIAANSSTILTHLNWGASYLVHDFYRRFLRPGRDERHYVRAGRLVTVGLFVCASGLVYLLDTAKNAFDVILQIGAGTGLLYLVRWFWWRVNAWCEIVAMISSFATSLVLLALARSGQGLSTHAALLVTVAVTTICWVLTAFVGPETDRRVLARFVATVKPVGPGWTRIRREAGLGDEVHVGADNIPMALLGWVTGCSAIWSALFIVGNVLYGRYRYVAILGVVFAISALVLSRIVRTLFSDERVPSASRSHTP
jgi:hypothetical protein